MKRTTGHHVSSNCPFKYNEYFQMKTSRVSLEVALNEINFILERIAPLSESSFDNDPLVQRATVLSLIIIGEETTKVNKKVKLKYSDIAWDLMKGMRNKMVHNYDGIDTAIVWKTVQGDIPELKSQIEKILSDEDELLNDQ
jgi:uncharacterized protein with HEPN domain